MKYPLITHDELVAIMDYDAARGVLIWRERGADDPNRYVGCAAGWLHHDGYIRLKLGQNNYYAHRLIWFYVHGEWPKRSLRHLNGDRADNRIVNLWEIKSGCTDLRNIQAKSNTKIKGVYHTKGSRDRYSCNLRDDDGVWRLKHFATLREAVAARQDFEVRVKREQDAARAAAIRQNGHRRGVWGLRQLRSETQVSP